MLAGVSGLLIAPVTHDLLRFGLLIGLKAFVGAMIGGLHSYPGAALGAVFVGLFESFASAFQPSSLQGCDRLLAARADPDVAVHHFAAY